MPIGMDFLEPVVATQRMDMLARAEPYKLAHEASLTRLQQSQAATMEAESAANARMERLMRGGMPAGETPVVRMQNLAAQAAGEGLINQATKLYQTASAMEAHEASKASHVASEQAARMRGRLDEAKLVGELMDGVTDEDTWNKANDVYASRMGRENPFAKLPYNPQFVKLLRGHAMTELQRSELIIKQDAEKRAATESAQREADRKARLAIAQRSANLADAREKRLEKEGGKTGTRSAVSPQLVKHAETLIDSMPDLELPDEARNLAVRDLASEAKVLLDNHPGLSGSEALQKVFEDARKSGRFQVVEEGNLPGFGRKGEDLPIIGKEGLLGQFRAKKVGKYKPPKVGPKPLQADRDYVKKHPEARQDFIDHFGEEP